MPVTNYNYMFSKSYEAGEIISLSDFQIWKYVNGESGLLYFGLGATLDPTNTAGESKVIHPTTAGQVLAGIVKYTDTFEQREGFTYTTYTVNNEERKRFGYPQGREVSLVRYGVVAVLVDSAISRGDPVFMRVANPGTGVLNGCFRNAAGTAATDTIQIPNASWESTIANAPTNSMAIAHLDLRLIPATP